MELNVSRITIFKRLGAMEILSEKNWKSATENPKITPFRNRVELETVRIRFLSRIITI